MKSPREMTETELLRFFEGFIELKLDFERVHLDIRNKISQPQKDQISLLLDKEIEKIKSQITEVKRELLKRMGS